MINLRTPPFGLIMVLLEWGMLIGTVHAEGFEDRGSKFPTVESIEDIKQQGFMEALEGIFPMSPGMVKEFLEAYRLNEKTILDRNEPKPLIGHELVSLESSSETQSVRLMPGIASAIGFYDAEGNSWPIQQVVVGNSEDFQIIQLGENANTITISPSTNVGWTNLVVALLDEPNPVVLKLIVDEQEAHFRLNFQILKHGPLTHHDEITSTQPISQAGNKDLLNTLSGTFTNQEAERVEVFGVEADAWIKDETLFLRSRYPLLSPTWFGTLKGPAGIHAYQLPVHSVLLFAVGEQIVRAELELDMGGLVPDTNRYIQFNGL